MRRRKRRREQNGSPAKYAVTAYMDNVRLIIVYLTFYVRRSGDTTTS